MLENPAFGVICNNNKVFFAVTYHSASSYHDFIYHSANGFTASAHIWPIYVPVICYTVSYTKFLGDRMESDPSLPLQGFLCKFGQLNFAHLPG